MTVAEWLTERMDNCHRLAAQNNGGDRAGWLDDAEYFKSAIDTIDRLAARDDKINRLMALNSDLATYGERLASTNAALCAALESLVTVADGTMDEDAADAYGLTAAVKQARFAIASAHKS